MVRDEGDARVLHECGGSFFGGVFMDLLQWNASTLEERWRLRCEGQIGALICLTAFGNLVIGGYSDKCLRVWNTATGGYDHVLRGHAGVVWCVIAKGEFLVSGSSDNTIKVWANEGDGSWPCLGTIVVHTGWVIAIVEWEGRVISSPGSVDKAIKVSDIVTRQHEATIYAHTGAVCVLAVSGRTLLSTGHDCTIGVWALGTWSHIRRIRVSEHVPDALYCCNLALSGSMLLCGGTCMDEKSGFGMVLDADTSILSTSAARPSRQ